MKIILVLLLSACFACSSKDIKPPLGDANKSIAELHPNADYTQTRAASVDTLKISNDEFIGRTDSELTLAHLSAVYNSVSPQTQYVSNSALSNVTDTLISITSGNDSILFHKGGGNTILEEMNIETQTLTFDTDIQIGISKSILLQKFGKTSLPDVFFVEDTEGGNRFTFIFSGGSLQKIIFRVVYL